MRARSVLVHRNISTDDVHSRNLLARIWQDISSVNFEHDVGCTIKVFNKGRSSSAFLFKSLLLNRGVFGTIPESFMGR